MGAVSTKFYTFGQNNSGGWFHEDKEAGIGYNVCIEAVDLDHAIARAENIGIYFDGVEDGRDCSCCGNRWYRPWKDEGAENPESEYGGELTGGWGHSSFIHYLDGRIEEITQQKGY